MKVKDDNMTIVLIGILLGLIASACIVFTKMDSILEEKTFYISLVNEEGVVKFLSEKYDRSPQVVLEITNICRQAGYHYDIDPLLLLAIIGVESEFNVTAVSHKGEQFGRGLMQVSVIGEKDYLRCGNPPLGDVYDPRVNIELGAWVYAKNRQYTMSNDTATLLRAYNEGAFSKSVSPIYSNKVLSLYQKILEIWNSVDDVTEFHYREIQSVGRNRTTK